MNNKLLSVPLSFALILATPAAALAGKVNLCVLSSCGEIRVRGYENPKYPRRQLHRDARKLKINIQSGMHKGFGQEFKRMGNNITKWDKFLGSQFGQLKINIGRQASKNGRRN